MKKFKKILLALFLVAGCVQGVFAEEDGYYEERKVFDKYVDKNNPHTETDKETGEEKWVGINNETGKKETFDLNKGEDPYDPETYTNHGYTIPIEPEPTYRTIKVWVPGEKATQKDLNEAKEDKVPPQSGLYDKKDEECNYINSKADDIIKKNDNHETGVNNSTIEENKKAGAEEVADPILSTSGQYVFSENDVEITIHGTTYNIGRFYNSGKTISDNLGTAWYFTLDSRVIRGERYDIEIEKDEIKQKYDDAYDIYQQTLAARDQIETTFNNEISSCEGKINYYQAQIDAITQDKDGSYLTDVTDFIGSIIDEYNNRIQDYTDRKKSELKAIDTVIANEKIDVNELEDKLTETENKLKHYKKNETYNTSLLNNDFAQNLNCGNDVLLIFDEKGTAYSYRLTAAPDYSKETNFYPNGSEAVSLIPGDYSRVTLNADGTVRWHRKDNQIWTYGADGHLIRMENLAGVGIDITYSEGRPKTIRFEEEILYMLNYDNTKRISTIQNQKDLTDIIIYHYNTDNRLEGITDNEGDTVSYLYNTDDRLYRIVKPDESFIEIKYEALINGEKWANKSIDEEGKVQEVRYNPIEKTVTEIDGEKVETTYVFDDCHNIKEEHYADGSVRIYDYDEHGNVKSETFRNDTTTYNHEYDRERKTRTTAMYSDGSTEIVEYNSNSQVTYSKDRDGVELVYDYDERNGNLLSVMKGNDLVFLALEYDNDLLKKSKDGLGVITEYEYDGYGKVECIKTGSFTERYTYDKRNRVSTCKDSEGNETIYSYTEKTRTEEHSNGLKRTYYYSDRKDLIQITQEDTILGQTRTTKFLYDKKHNLLETRYFSGTGETGEPVLTEQYTYRDNNEIKSVTYSDGSNFWKTEYLYYEDSGKLKGTVTSRNGQSRTYQENYLYSEGNNGDDIWTMVVRGENKGSLYKYDLWGRVKSVTNALGETSGRELSPGGRVSKENSSHGGSYIYEYTNGNLTGLGEENKKQVITDYYADGSVKTVTDRLGNKTEYFYNEQGLLDRSVSKENITWYTYDKTGRITGQYITEPNAISYKSNVDSYITYSYKDKGRTVTASYGGLYTKTMKLNAFGEVIEVTDGEGNTVKYEYDALGRQTAVYDGYDRAERYAYNALGLVAKVTYRDGSTESYEYDCLGNITEITDSEGIKAEYGYDSDGRLISAKERGSALTEYEYDVLDRVTKVKLAGSVVEQYEYTPLGRKTTVTDGNENKYRYNYNEFGRLVNETNRLEDSQYYFYDDEGSLKEKKDFEAKTTAYKYDYAARTKTVYYPDGSTEVYEYSAGGNLLHVTGETGTISYTYNKAGLPVSQVDHTAGETTYYSYNKAGLKSKVQSDSRTIAYTYGKNGEVTKVEDYTSKMSVTLTYDVMGRETKRRYKNGVSENTVYDSIGRVILKSETDVYGKISFAESYVYDSEGRRTITVNAAGGVTVYKYNERGELQAVYYPYSENLEHEAKKEALEAGLYPKYPGYEWYDYSAEEAGMIRQAWSRIYKNTPLWQQKGQRVWSEQYTYDNNSNRLTKTTQYGTINYTYDDENRLRYSGREKLVNLEEEIGGRITFRENEEIYHAATADSVSYSTDSLKGTRFTYDKNGNMLSSENLYSVKFFDYNANNRMKLSTVTDLTEHTYTATTYAYDGLGRRTLTQTEGHTATRTLYDGTGFEILRQGTADSNGSFVNYTEAQNRYSPYNPYGGGYYGNRWGYADYFYYLFFGGIWGFGAGGHGSNGGKEEAPEYLTIENMYPLYANGTVAGSYKEDLVYSPHQHYWNSWTNFWGADTSRHDDYATYKETLYFGTDILGSVRSTTDSRSVNSGSVSYDVFGSPYRRTGSFQNSESLDFGYLGKPYNATTELYDYGFRDYSPGTARFTTVDPIRDGRNWYSYVLNDPVNFVDLWGLECETGSDKKDSKTIIYLDPGHGGEEDDGSKYGKLKEKDLNLKVSLLVKNNLEKYGYNVYISREEDVSVPLKQRYANANSLKSSLFVSIHTNSTNPLKSGYSVIYPNDTKFNKEKEQNRQEQSKKLADKIAESMSNSNIKEGPKGVYSDEDGLAVLRGTDMPAVLVEMGYILTDRKALSKESYLETIADAISTGIHDYIQDSN